MDGNSSKLGLEGGFVKAELRRRMREILRGSADSELEKGIGRIIEHLKRRLDGLAHGACVGLFGGLRGEPDLVLELGEWLRGRAVRTVVFEFGAGGMVPREVRSVADVRRASPGVWEPVPERTREVPVSELSVVLVPGVAFSRSGKRLGRGGGYYDRLLRDVSPETRRIGVILDSFLVEEIPEEAHDQRVAELVTESGWILQGTFDNDSKPDAVEAD